MKLFQDCGTDNYKDMSACDCDKRDLSPEAEVWDNHPQAHGKLPFHFGKYMELR